MIEDGEQLGGVGEGKHLTMNIHCMRKVYLQLKSRKNKIKNELLGSETEVSDKLLRQHVEEVYGNMYLDICNISKSCLKASIKEHILELFEHVNTYMCARLHM